MARPKLVSSSTACLRVNELTRRRMKRDMDLVRKIMLAIESSNARGEIAVHIDEYPGEVISYHLGLLREAGLIKAIDATTVDGEDYIPLGLTWAGHEFLDTARNENLWNKVKGKIAPTVGTVSLDLLKELLILGAKEALGLKS